MKHSQDTLCFHCNKHHDNIMNYTVSNRGYHSHFDGMNFSIQLCEQCNNELDVDSKWFDNSDSFCECNGGYQNESYIIYLVEEFPVCNQEYVYNCPVNNGEKPMSREDWLELNS